MQQGDVSNVYVLVCVLICEHAHVHTDIQQIWLEGNIIQKS